jgi:hypothetical protein
LIKKYLNYFNKSNLDFQNNFRNIDEFVRLMDDFPKDLHPENIELLNKVNFK